MPQKSKVSSNIGKMFNGRDERRVATAPRHMQLKAGPQKSGSFGKQVTAVDSQKCPSGNNGNGIGRPQAPKSLPAKIVMTSTDKKIIPPSAKNGIPVVRKPLPSKPRPSSSKLNLDQRRGLQACSKDKMLVRKQSMSTKPQVQSCFMSCTCLRILIFSI